MKLKLQPQVVSSAHGYTREDVPWDLSDSTSTRRGRLARFLAGGGMKTFGRTIHQQKAARRHTRFWIVFVSLFAIWLLSYLI